jgi:NAD+ diphosphatase
MLASELPMLARSVFDRAAHHRGDPEWQAKAWSEARVLLVSPGSTTPVRLDGDVFRIEFSAPDDIADTARRWFLGVADEVAYFAVVTEQADSSWVGIRDIGPRGDELELDLLVTAIALTQWHARHGRCALCGAETEIDQAGWTRRCPVDNSQHFPRTDPAVIMLVHDGGDKCLLGRGVAWAPGRFSTLAGFVEPGESLEAAVIREVFEETGVVVADVQYVASQPWPFPSSLMLGFTARVDGALSATPDLVEMAEAGWFTREQVRAAATWTDSAEAPPPGAGLGAIPPGLSISRYLIDEWLAGRLPK